MPDVNQPLPPSAPPSAPESPEIKVIPDKFYGAALKARIDQPVKPNAEVSAPTATLPRKRGTLFVIGALGLLIVVGIGLYLNRQSLFGQTSPAPKVVTAPPPSLPPAPPPQPPTAPTGLSATSTNPQNVALAWSDASDNELGFRLERAEGINPFQSLTNVPANSVSFLDTSVSPGKSYRYRVVAIGEAGEAPSLEVSVNVASLPPPPPEQPKLPPAGLDTDSDGLTDVEELLYGTDLKNPDTDGDGFLDGNEVFNLYNANGAAPATLLSAKLARPVTAPLGWSMHVPTSWVVNFTQADGARATITSGHGETFSVSIEDNPQSTPVIDWYLAKYPEVQANQLLQYRSKRGYSGIIGADLLTTYIPWGNQVFVFKYDLKGQTFINYRTTYYMLLNSLELKGAAQSKVSGVSSPLPFEPSATTTGKVALPLSVSISTTTSAVVTKSTATSTSPAAATSTVRSAPTSTAPTTGAVATTTTSTGGLPSSGVSSKP